ncbi:hypothetical protein HYFRA_00000816 [Hymenoscyphus fraxineus]|uniref:ABM domain-containing protein n=1 Tax=Hymenoscyphus fraxineus TaxID=746836 RepID=A0A9N9KSW0_9HELO|nr:hypothetical protein HYFRA_00000816 [Hymenoscyphus fraxineus]
MSSAFHVIAVCSVAEGKVDRLIELLANVSRTVSANEPGVLQYEVFQAYDVETKQPNGGVTLVERYVDQAAYDAHASSAHMAVVFQTLAAEGIMTAPPQITYSRSVGGFVKY